MYIFLVYIYERIAEIDVCFCIVFRREIISYFQVNFWPVVKVQSDDPRSIPFSKFQPYACVDTKRSQVADIIQHVQHVNGDIIQTKQSNP